MAILPEISGPDDVKRLDAKQLDELAAELRQTIIDTVSRQGGHLASNLGVVELTIAMFCALNLPKDKIIWDVGHQSYTHKILSGRKDNFDGLRQYGGLSGFPKRKESPFDAFDTGHSSTSISAGLGMAQGRDLLGEDYSIVSVIGDGALTGGMAYEALNNAGRLKTNFIIVLNDNNMSISENVGGLSSYLAGFRTADAYLDLKLNVLNSLNKMPYGEKMVSKIRKTKSGIKQLLIPGMFFEEMGIVYLGPVDGGDLHGIVKLLREASHIDGPVLIHVMTHKGAGYAPAERHPARFHGTEPFDIETGLPKNPRVKANYTDIFSTVMRKLGDRDEKVVAVTAAMTDGTGLKRFHNMFPERFFDVGIAEQHAVTFAAGLAAAGLKPIFAVYSSFLQRAYDQIIHDVGLQKLPVVFAVDRAGLVGSDGETHQGIFDLSFLSSIPNMTVMSPKHKWELADMLRFALKSDGPVAIRYPRGAAYDQYVEYRAPIEYGKSEIICEESGIALISMGHMFEEAVKVRKNLKDAGYSCTLVNGRFVKPIDEECIARLAKNHKLIAVLEENVITGGYGMQVLECAARKQLSCHVLPIALPDNYVEHGSVEVLRKETGIDAQSVTEKIMETYKELQI